MKNKNNKPVTVRHMKSFNFAPGDKFAKVRPVFTLLNENFIRNVMLRTIVLMKPWYPVLSAMAANNFYGENLFAVATSFG